MPRVLRRPCPGQPGHAGTLRAPALRRVQHRVAGAQADVPHALWHRPRGGPARRRSWARGGARGGGVPAAAALGAQGLQGRRGLCRRHAGCGPCRRAARRHHAGQLRRGRGPWRPGGGRRQPGHGRGRRAPQARRAHAHQQHPCQRARATAIELIHTLQAAGRDLYVDRFRPWGDTPVRVAKGARALLARVLFARAVPLA